MEVVKQSFKGIGKLVAIILVGAVIALSLFFALIAMPYAGYVKFLQ